MKQRSDLDRGGNWAAVSAVIDRLRREDVPDEVAVRLLIEAAGPELMSGVDSPDSPNPFPFSPFPKSPQPRGVDTPIVQARGTGLLPEHLAALVRAAFEGEAIPALEPDKRETIRKERILGSSPLDEAFTWLADLEPRLLDVADEVRSGAWLSAQLDTHLRSTRAKVDSLVGPRAEHPSDELLRTDTAREAVDRYLSGLRSGVPHHTWSEPDERPSLRTVWARARAQQRPRRHGRWT